MAGNGRTPDVQRARKRLWTEDEISDDETDVYTTSSSENEDIDLYFEIAKLLHTSIIKKQVDAIYRIRRVLYRDSRPTIDRLFKFQVDLVPRLVEFLKGDNCTLQYYAAVILRNLASGTLEQALVLVEYQAIPNLCRLLRSTDEAVQIEAILALGEIASDRAECKKLVLDQGVLTVILEILDKNKSISTTAAAACCLALLCQGDLPNESQVLSTVHSLLQNPHRKILEHACTAVAMYINSSDGQSKKRRIRAVIDQGLFKRLVQLLSSSSGRILEPLLTIVGIFSTDEELIPTLIDFSVLPKLLHLLENGTHSLRKKACQIITNITAGNKEHVQAVVDEFIFPSLVGILDSNEAQLLQAATEAIHNAASKGTQEHIQALVQMGCVESLCDLLCIDDDKIIELVLNTLLNILETDPQQGQQSSPTKVRKKSGVEMLQNLLHHENEKIRESVCAILQRFFSNEMGEKLKAQNT